MVRANGGAGAASKADPAHLDALARQALAHDPEAVRRFLLAIAPAIWRACRGVMGSRHTDLEDTIQECFVDVMRGLPSYRFEGSLLGFVAKIAVRRALLSRRRRPSSSWFRRRHRPAFRPPKSACRSPQSAAGRRTASAPRVV